MVSKGLNKRRRRRRRRRKIYNPLLLFVSFGVSLAGYQCPTPAHPPRACQLGTYSPGAVQQCLVCPEGYFANYTGAVECELCPGGYHCPTASVTPLICPAGQYRFVLSDAVFGIHSKSNRPLSLTVCPPPSPPPSVCPFLHPSLHPSPPPFPLSLGGSTSCLPCPLGHYSSPQTPDSCTPCPPGTLHMQ